MHRDHVRSILRRQNGIKIVKFGESMDAPGYEYIWRHYRAAAAAPRLHDSAPSVERLRCAGDTRKKRLSF